MMAQRGKKVNNKPRSRMGKEPNDKKRSSPGRTPKRMNSKVKQSKVPDNKRPTTPKIQAKKKKSEPKVEPKFIPAGTDPATLDTPNKNKKEKDPKVEVKKSKENNAVVKNSSIREAVQRMTDATPEGERFNFTISDQSSTLNAMDKTKTSPKQEVAQKDEPNDKKPEKVPSTSIQRAVQKMTDDTPEGERVDFAVSGQKSIGMLMDNTQQDSKNPPVQSVELKNPEPVVVPPKQQNVQKEDENIYPLVNERSMLEVPYAPPPKKKDGSTSYTLHPQKIDADLIGRTGMYIERAPLEKDRKQAFDWLALNRHEYQNDQKNLAINLGEALYDVGVKKELLMETINILAIDRLVTAEESIIINNLIGSYKSGTIPLANVAWMLKENCKAYQ